MKSVLTGQENYKSIYDNYYKMFLYCTVLSDLYLGRPTRVTFLITLKSKNPCEGLEYFNPVKFVLLNLIIIT